MKIPIYQEVRLSSNDLDQDLANAPWGQGPAYILFPPSSGVEFQKMALARLKQLLLKRGIDCYFPYPIYVISTLPLGRVDFQVLPHESKLPGFFKSRRRELTAKEIPFIKKIQLLANKVVNSKVDEKMAQIQQMAIRNRELFNLTSETHFYQTIRKKLKDNEKTKRHESRSGKKP